jgi:hypothetical protein
MKAPNAMAFLAMPAVAIRVNNQQNENQQSGSQKNNYRWLVVPQIAQKRR